MEAIFRCIKLPYAGKPVMQCYPLCLAKNGFPRSPFVQTEFEPSSPPLSPFPLYLHGFLKHFTRKMQHLKCTFCCLIARGERKTQMQRHSLQFALGLSLFVSPPSPLLSRMLGCLHLQTPCQEAFIFKIANNE